MAGDVNTYKKLRGNPTNKLRALLKRTTKQAQEKGILTKKEARYLVPDAPRLPVIYQLPKIHKNKDCTSGKPIISGINSVLSRIGEYLDCFLQPIVNTYSAYLRDSKHLMNILKETPPMTIRLLSL